MKSRDPSYLFHHRVIEGSASLVDSSADYSRGTSETDAKLTVVRQLHPSLESRRKNRDVLANLQHGFGARVLNGDLVGLLGCEEHVTQSWSGRGAEGGDDGSSYQQTQQRRDKEHSQCNRGESRRNSGRFRWRIRRERSLFFNRGSQSQLIAEPP